MTERDTILSALPEGVSRALPKVFERGRPDPKDLWLEFEERLVTLGGQMLPLDTLSLLLGRGGGYWADDDALMHLPRGLSRPKSVWEAEIGVCLADMAVAETGSLVLSAGPGRSRLTSLAPPVNVILVDEDRIVATPESAFENLARSTSVMVTGTSRTADIEGVMVRGVHGPRELYVVRLESGEQPNNVSEVPQVDSAE